MRVSPLLSLPVALLYLTSSAFAESSAGGRSVAEILQDANRLLATGSYSDAARAYGEAIGE
jgi:Flp pilus assembly protein TadG